MPRTKPPSGQQPPSPARERKKQLQRLRSKLEGEYRSWLRWLSRLKRAFHAFVKSQGRVARLQRQISRLHEGKGSTDQEGQAANE
jgi:hypothetical protein